MNKDRFNMETLEFWNLEFQFYISSECFKSVSILLNNGYGYMSRFTGINVSNCS